MGALMQVERGDGPSATTRALADSALNAVRDALGRLQSLPGNMPAVEQATAAVASSLGLVHGLTRHHTAAPPMGQGNAQGGFAPPNAPAQGARAAQPPQFAATMQQPPQQFVQPNAPPMQHQPPHNAAPAQQYVQPQAPQQQRPAAQPGAYAPHTQPTPPARPAAAQKAVPQAPPPSPSAAPDSVAPPPGVIEAELGAHSSSNFYKTLSGNDIVDHGGNFVSTYASPPIGSAVMIRIHLPGGYHFDCQGRVKWTRDARDNPDAPPGFGAQFQGISAEQRQLIQRYVRNREPLFYDDL
ncbi:MAG: hypothetical protein NVSMB1_01720 [Polyangiales bacterium]